MKKYLKIMIVGLFVLVASNAYSVCIVKATQANFGTCVVAEFDFEICTLEPNWLAPRCYFIFTIE